MLANLVTNSRLTLTYFGSHVYLNNPQLHIVADRPLASFEVPGLTCFCRRVDSQKSRTMSETQVDLSQPTLIHCGPLSVPPGEQYQCGVVLNPEQKVLR